MRGRQTISDLQAVADRVEIEALRGEYTDAVMMRAYADGWKFTERVYEVRYLDHSALAGSAPAPLGAAADPPGTGRWVIPGPCTSSGCRS